MKIKLRGGVSLAEQISFYRQLAVILRLQLPAVISGQLLQQRSQLTALLAHSHQRNRQMTAAGR